MASAWNEGKWGPRNLGQQNNITVPVTSVVDSSIAWKQVVLVDLIIGVVNLVTIECFQVMKLTALELIMVGSLWIGVVLHWGTNTLEVNVLSNRSTIKYFFKQCINTI
jgi:hypothetical protein